MYEQERDEEQFIEPKRARRIRERTRIQVKRSRKNTPERVGIRYTRKRKHKEEVAW
jgi:hypothetical protein